MAEKKTVRVKVIEPYRVVHGDKPHVGGDEVSVPEATAQDWERNGWVERVAAKKK